MPHLHILHPPEHRLPGVTSWLGELQQLLLGEPAWNRCVFHQHEYDDQAAFNVPTVFGIINQALGPVILLQKVQARVREQLEKMLQRNVKFYLVNAGCPEDVWEICEIARQEYEGGEPTVPLREAIAFLIMKKLKKKGRWGGTNNKNFLTCGDLPSGGFPKDIITPRDVIDVANALVLRNLLQTKVGGGETKYALGEMRVVQPIFDDRSFISQPALRRFFERVPKRVSIRTFDYNE